MKGERGRRRMAMRLCRGDAVGDAVGDAWMKGMLG